MASHRVVHLLLVPRMVRCRILFQLIVELVLQILRIPEVLLVAQMQALVVVQMMVAGVLRMLAVVVVRKMAVVVVRMMAVGVVRMMAVVVLRKLAVGVLAVVLAVLVQPWRRVPRST